MKRTCTQVNRDVSCLCEENRTVSLHLVLDCFSNERQCTKLQCAFIVNKNNNWKWLFLCSNKYTLCFPWAWACIFHCCIGYSANKLLDFHKIFIVCIDSHCVISAPSLYAIFSFVRLLSTLQQPFELSFNLRSRLKLSYCTFGFRIVKWIAIRNERALELINGTRFLWQSGRNELMMLKA